MNDELTEELAAIRRIREQRFRELMRDLEERALRSSRESNTAESQPQERLPETSPSNVAPAHRTAG